MLTNKDQPIPTKDQTDPCVGIIVVGNDPEVCAGVANMVRAGLAFIGGVETVPMEKLADTKAFMDISQYRDTEYLADEAESMWMHMRRERPTLDTLVVPIEIHEGGASGKESVLLEGAIITKDFKLVSSAKYTRFDD